MRPNFFKQVLAGIALVSIMTSTTGFIPFKDDCGTPALYDEAIKKLKKFSLIKDYTVYIKKKKKKDGSEFVKQTISLSRGVRYKFYAIQNKEYDGVPVVTIFNNEKQEFLVATTYNSTLNRTYEEIEFECKTSGNYCLTFSFMEGKEGCAIGVSSFLK